MFAVTFRMRSSFRNLRLSPLVFIVDYFFAFLRALLVGNHIAFHNGIRTFFKCLNSLWVLFCALTCGNTFTQIENRLSGSKRTFLPGQGLRMEALIVCLTITDWKCWILLPSRHNAFSSALSILFLRLQLAWIRNVSIPVTPSRMRAASG